ncbi:MAG: GntR family transcriptional regulator [Actinomycetia bacterium]|nr:GntR family transcriptional regulator [Actinomycetes bacterium]
MSPSQSKTESAPQWLTSVPAFKAGTGRPLHTQIERWLIDVIGRGDLVNGDRLPREADLAAALGVSRMTLRQALTTMEDQGTVVRKTGRSGGTYVSEPRIECDLTGLAGFTEQMRRANIRVGARVISSRTMPATAAVAAALSIQRSDSVHEVVRVRTARREPLALERSYFPAEVFPDLLDHRLTGSLYELLRRHYGQTPYVASEILDPVIAGARAAELLGVEANSALMLIERTASTAAGLPIEYARDLFRPDRVRISFRTGLGVDVTSAD